MDETLGPLLEAWRADSMSTYNSWFLWEERLKNFRSIRTGLQAVVREIRSGTFGNSFRGSSLETVVRSIAEQRQIFKGADHAFLWKPKLRIPDIYENPENQRAFGEMLDTCLCCNTEEQVVSAIHRIDAKNIKGLGPAVANLLYFLHPTIMPPSNTAIVKGFNLLFDLNMKLGSWDQYLAMRSRVLETNSRYRNKLSNDLGAVAGLMFDVGNGRYPVPESGGVKGDSGRWLADLAVVRQQGEKEARASALQADADSTHTEVQGWLRDLGHALGFDVWIAANDQNRLLNGGRLGDNCLMEMPTAISDAAGAETVRLIDVIWFDNQAGKALAAFEVEHTTSIYSGIVRMLDLALSGGIPLSDGLFLVAPDERENDVRNQLTRPAFKGIADLHVRYIPYSELKANRAAAARFGEGLKVIRALARPL